jgi:hypothetical protein
MHAEKLVFAQLMGRLPLSAFRQLRGQISESLRSYTKIFFFSKVKLIWGSQEAQPINILVKKSLQRLFATTI